MNDLPTIRAYRVGTFPAHDFKPYVYNGTVKVEADPEVAKSYAHGTASAARLHYLRGEKPCDECQESERERWREAKRRQGPRKPAVREFTPDKCGTNAGHQRHIQYQNTPCDACMVAHRAYQQARRDARKAAKA